MATKPKQKTSAKEKLRTGIIGAGSIAQECHIKGYVASKRVELIAFADINKDRHAEIEQRYPGMTGYTDFKKMLEKEKLDVVSVCTPNSTHAVAAIAALEAGCHVLCEKPMATTLKDTDLMIETAQRKRKKLMIGFTHRLLSGPKQCKEILKNKELGKPFEIRVRFAHGGPHPGWARDPKTFYNQKIAGGGAMLDMGIHAIDLALWLFGPVASVSARAETLVKKIEVDDNALLLLKFKSGALGCIEVGWTSKPGFTGLEIYGTEGSLICDYLKGLSRCGGRASAGADSSVEWSVINEKPAEGGWSAEIDYWLDVVEGKEKLEMDGKAGRAALEVALAAYESSKKGKEIILS